MAEASVPWLYRRMGAPCADGRASTILTLGSQPGANTVVASAKNLDPVTFTATASIREDFDGDGTVGFGDFLVFAGTFGQA